LIEPLLGEITESISVHDRTVKIGFMLYELLHKAGYDDEEISEVANSNRTGPRSRLIRPAALTPAAPAHVFHFP